MPENQGDQVDSLVIDNTILTTTAKVDITKILPKAEEFSICSNAVVIENINFKTQSSATPVINNDESNNLACFGKISKCFKRLEGILLIMIASIIFTTTGAIAKYLKYIPPGEIVMSSGFFSSLFLLQYTTFLGISLWRFQAKPLVYIRAGMGSIGYVMKIYCIQNMNYGDATALLFTGPIFAGLFARIFLKEKYNIVNIVASINGLIGIILISKPTFVFGRVEGETRDSLLPTSIAILAAAVMGACYCCMRKIGPRVNSAVVSTYLCMFQILAGTGYQVVTTTPVVSPFCYDGRILLAFSGIMAGISYICLNRGVAIEKTGPASLIRNLDTVLAYIIQIVFFKVTPDWMSLLGAFFIISGTVAVTVDKLVNKSNRCEF